MVVALAVWNSAVSFVVYHEYYYNTWLCFFADGRFTRNDAVMYGKGKTVCAVDVDEKLIEVLVAHCLSIEELRSRKGNGESGWRELGCTALGEVCGDIG